MNLKDHAITIWQSGVDAVDARKLVRDSIQIIESDSNATLRIGDERFPLNRINRIVVVGFGKASGAMAVGFEQALANQNAKQLNVSGWINVPDAPETLSRLAAQRRSFAFPILIDGCRPPGENLPTESVLAGTEKIIDLVQSTGPDDICICLISGGGSALLEQPVKPISLDEFRAATTFLSSAGANIYDLNAVRRAISQVKGGGLARRANCPIVSLIISDAIGDPVDVISSGPTVEATDSISALEILRRYDSNQTSIPDSIWKVVESTQQLQPSIDKLPSKNYVIGNIESAMVAAREKAIELGYEVELTKPNGDEGDAELVGSSVAIEIARASSDSKMGKRPICKIMGGETTVPLCQAPGRGGRNQHLVLSAFESLLSFQLDPEVEYALLSGGTDGEDGNVPVAGAVFDSGDIEMIESSEQIRNAISNCNSHEFLAAHNLLLKTPATFTNVCDLRIVLVGQKGVRPTGT